MSHKSNSDLEVKYILLMNTGNENSTSQRLGNEAKGLFNRPIQEITHLQDDQKVLAKFVGIVLKVTLHQQKPSIVLSDGTATAQVNIGHQFKRFPTHLLPNQGDSLMVIGKGYKKTLGRGSATYSFLKIIAMNYKVIEPQEELKQAIQGYVDYKIRKKDEESNEAQLYTMRRQVPLPRANVPAPIDQIEVRTHIFTYIFFVFEHNEGITTYSFNSDMVAFNRETRQFYQSKNISKEAFIKTVEIALEDLNIWGLMEFKQQGDKKFSTVGKQLFSGIEKVMMDKILDEEHNKGVTADTLTKMINQKLKQFAGCSEDVVNFRITHKILSKMLNQSKIYKTCDRLIFPNIAR